jgi:hypothetical protein
VDAVQAVAHHALQHIDLTTHAAQHPRLGVLDHVSLHPLGPQATLSLAAQAATAIGQQLAQSPLQLPVYFYGAAHPQYRRLAEIRRRLGEGDSCCCWVLMTQTCACFVGAWLHKAATSIHIQDSLFALSCKSKVSTLRFFCRCAGYFKPTTTSSSSSGGGDGSSEGWCGSVSQLQLSAYPPDAGPVTATPAEGVVTIGAVPWVTNYNVPLHTGDMAAAKAVARAVSSKGGGLPGVEVRLRCLLLGVSVQEAAV